MLGGRKMAYQYLTNTPLEKAVEEYLSVLENLGMKYKTQQISVSEACGKITSKAVYAKICAPHYNACAMDGIALKASYTFGATETTPVTIQKELFAYVDTGDPLPKEFDSVVMIEDVSQGDDGSVVLHSCAVPWQHIRQIGEDICAGDMILPSFTQVTPAAMGAMLAGGVMSLSVVKPPVVGIIPTGDEIIPPSENPKEGEIIEFNSTIFSGILNTWGAKAKTYPIVLDKKELIINAVQKAVNECDVVILNAGSSAGTEDFSRLAVENVGKVLYHGIAIKPGKPAILGYADSVPILGVPGYPVSGIIVLEHILKPIIERLCKQNLDNNNVVNATVGRRMTSSLKYREFVRTRVGINEKGEYTAVPLSRGAGVVTSFVKADGIIDVPQDCEGYEAGQIVRVNLLRSEKELRNTMSIIGSHDPLIDEITDILKINYNNCFVASSHTGSMGGIMAVKRGEAHLGGVHLLDEQSGEYNVSYIKKYFPNGEVVLVRGVKRIQGIIVQKSNPQKIKGIEDIAQNNLSYVNRQKGSGTRILFDYLCSQKNIDKSKIYGYEREEFTHTGVAAQIAAKTAHAGLGIYSASKTYDLDFIPVCNEEYDFLISKQALDNENVQKFLQVLSGDDLKKRLEKLGGYNTDFAGEIKEEF